MADGTTEAMKAAFVARPHLDGDVPGGKRARAGRGAAARARVRSELVTMQREVVRKSRERMNADKNLFLGLVVHDPRDSLGVI